MSSVQQSRCVVDRSGISALLDKAMFTMHWRAVVPGLPDELADFDHHQRDLATTKLKTFWNAVKGNISSGAKFLQVDWYDIDPSDPFKHKFIETFLTSGGSGLPGLDGGTPVPPQDAVSVTFKTDTTHHPGVRGGHWGRFYLPCLTQSTNYTSPGGSVDPSFVSTLASAAAALTDRGGTIGVDPTHPTVTVWSPTANSHYDPISVQVDNVWDIQRSRRYNKSNYKVTVNAG
jgi:hypothetical protein